MVQIEGMLAVLALDITDSAKSRLKEILKDNARFVISVVPGGCSEFSYCIKITPLQELSLEDFIDFGHGVLVKRSVSRVLGDLTLDYKSDLISSKFVISNAKSKSTCSCKESFSI